jgi:hypothetical protein
MHRSLTLAVLSAALLLLGGCDLRERFASADDRVNAAVPLAADVQQAHARLLQQVSAVPADRTTMDNAWRGRLRARATSCSPDFAPTWRQSSDEVRAAVGNTACFADFDRKLARWVGVQRTRLLLAQAPLALGELPPSITVQGQLVAASAQAPVVAVTSGEGFELMAVDGRSLFKERGASGQLSLSPNGRLFAQSVSGDVSRIRAVEGGETLLELTDARSVQWLGDWLVGIRSARGKPSSVLSLNTGEEAPVIVNNVGAYPHDTLLPVPGGGSRFNLLSFTGLYQLEAQESGGRLVVTAVAEKPGTPRALMAIASGAGRLSADGRSWLLDSSSQGLVRLDLTTLEIQETSFLPMLLSGVTSTGKPDQYLLDLRAPMEAPTPGARMPHLYDAAAGTLAPLQGADAERSFMYLPGVKRLARLSQPTVWLVEKLQVGEAQPMSDLLNAQLEQVNQARLNAVQLEAQRGLNVAPYFAPAPGAAPALPVAAPLLPGAREAQVEGVGIYEAVERIAQPGQSRSTGRVSVTVRRANQPLVLVLSSYEPVQWQLKLEPGARLAAVLVASYHDSTVVGAGDVRVFKIGRQYAYQQDGPEFASLQREVTRWAGRPIALFQSGYRGNSYTVGGR